MKKVIIFAMLCACAMMTGCKSAEEFVADNAVDINEKVLEEGVDVNTLIGNQTDREQVSENDNTVHIWTDPETGVQYIIYREKTMNAGFGGITPRLNPDGSLYIVDVMETEGE